MFPLLAQALQVSQAAQSASRQQGVVLWGIWYIYPTGSILTLLPSPTNHVVANDV